MHHDLAPMKATTALKKLSLAISMTTAVSIASAAIPARAQTASFVSTNSRIISGEISELSHVIMIQIPRPLVLDIGANEGTTLTVPSLSEIVINGQRIAPAQTPVLIAVEPAEGKKSAQIRAKGIMLQGKLIAIEAHGDLIPSFVVNKKEFNERVKAAMNLGAVVGNGLAGAAGANMLGMIGQSLGDPTGTNLANQITSTGGLLSIVGGIFGGGGGKRIIDLHANSIHVLTVKNLAMIVAQMIQMQREIAAGNSQIAGAIASQIKSGNESQIQTDRSLAVAQQPRRQTPAESERQPEPIF